MSGKKEYGDYQTPQSFADSLCSYLQTRLNLTPDVIIEPTCGKGNFIQSCLIFSPAHVIGIEIKPEYAEECRARFKDNKSVSIINKSIFSFKTNTLFPKADQILILGNPPWVTNTELSSENSENLPQKSNFKGIPGLEALTGAGNFDISESIIQQLINEYKYNDVYFSLICKTAIARNLYKELARQNIPFDYFHILEIDAKKIFKVNTSACIMIFKLSSAKNHSSNLLIKRFDMPDLELSQYYYENGKLIKIRRTSSPDLEGYSCFEWRQGIKHDCSKIMELTFTGSKLINGNDEIADIETPLVYPLVKSSMFKKPIKTDFSKFVLITQSRINQDTSYIEKKYPKTWRYLTENQESFYKRKSSVYLKSPKFAIFGIGDYSFSRYKVGISGFYKKPTFSLLYTDNKPVMLDDTSYFIGFDSYDNAYTALLLLNSTIVQEYLENISFHDAKRPYTKKVLSRLDFSKIIKNTDCPELKETEKRLCLNSFISDEKYEDFKKLIPSELF